MAAVLPIERSALLSQSRVCRQSFEALLPVYTQGQQALLIGSGLRTRAKAACAHQRARRHVADTPCRTASAALHR